MVNNFFPVCFLPDLSPTGLASQASLFHTWCNFTRLTTQQFFEMRDTLVPPSLSSKSHHHLFLQMPSKLCLLLCYSVKAPTMKHSEGTLLIDQDLCVHRQTDVWGLMPCLGLLVFSPKEGYRALSLVFQHIQTHSPLLSTHRLWWCEMGPLLCQEPSAWPRSWSGEANPLSRSLSAAWQAPSVTSLSSTHDEMCVCPLKGE